MRTLNLGILAHVDAGKTTLTERLLFTTGAIGHIGSVDAGTTQTDTLALERERGITIRAAVASFRVGDVAVNLVDTPGHPDFIAEVERALSVLDGAVLVVSAVEGIQPQTPLLFRALRRLRVPTLVFVNKVDRAGADPERILEGLARRLSPAVIPMAHVRNAGTKAVEVVPLDAGDEAFGARLAEMLADHDEAILEAFVAGGSALPAARLRAALAAQVRAGVVHPVLFGSAAMGIGTEPLLDGIVGLLPGESGDPDAPVSGRVFKIERTPAGERVAYVRLFHGTLHPRQKVRVGGDLEAKPTAVAVFAPAGSPRRDALGPGEMATVRGLGAVRVGDVIGVPRPGEAETTSFPRPGLEAVVSPLRAGDAGSLRAALAQLAEQDPLIDVRQDDRRHEIAVSIYGEVQKEVIAATLDRDYGIPTTFRETTVVCIERPAGVGEAAEVIHARTHSNITGRSSADSTNPFLATLALRVEPLPPGSGVIVGVDVEPRLVPLYLFRTPEAFAAQMEGFVREALEEGPVGWQVADCRVTVTEAGYMSPASTLQDFRRLTQLVLAQALERARTWVCQPMADITLEVPSATSSGVVAAIRRLDGHMTGQLSARGTSVISGIVPVARVRLLQGQLPSLSMGEGVLETRPAGYLPVGDDPPRRERSSPSPLERDAWLAWLAKRL